MKISKNACSGLVLIVFVLLFAASATEKKLFYQSYRAMPENGTLSKNDITFEDENCLIRYNLWAEGGDAGFSVFNKTPGFLKIDLEKSFFVINGVAFPYFQNRTFTTGYDPVSYLPSVTKEEMPTRIIPPHTSVKITEYSITDQFYADSTLFKYPSKNQIKARTFEKSTSPFVFYNLISYSFNGVEKIQENRFYVSEIKNLPDDEMTGKDTIKENAEQTKRTVEIYKDAPANGFFIKYEKEVASSSLGL
ncbi:MAG TPA: hypothetical protein PLK12_10620 [Prolixibacteraceae bacterium]|nr:hypothetical protein [Prolixibacteraceae bacterium]